MNETNPSGNRLFVSVGAFCAVVVAAFIFAFAERKSGPIATDVSSVTVVPSTPSPSQTPSTSVPGATPTAIKPTSTPVTATEYMNGTYTATGTYDSPGGRDQIGVSLTITDDIVTAASVTPMPGDPTSAKYQQKFASGYQAQVVGKPLDSIHLDEVSGSSLTPIGFDSALAAIKAKAKSS